MWCLHFSGFDPSRAPCGDFWLGHLGHDHKHAASGGNNIPD